MLTQGTLDLVHAYTNYIVTTPCILSQCDEFIMVTCKSDKFQCIIPRFLTAYSFFKASLSGNKSVVAGR